MSDSPTNTTLATSSNSPVLKTFAAGLFATLLTDEEKLVQAPIDAYLGSLAANGSIENATAQTALFQPAILAVAPNAASTGIQDTALALKNLVDVQLPSLVAAMSAEAEATAKNSDQVVS